MKDRQMLFRDDNLSMESEALELIDLFASGLHWLGLLEKEQDYARYSDWIKLLKIARSYDKQLDDKKLTWLWEAITSEPGIKRNLRDRIVSLADEWKSIEPFECLPGNSDFGIFLKGFQAFGYPVLTKIKDIEPDAEEKILGPLQLRPGKA